MIHPWLADIREKLAAMPFSGPEEARPFFEHHFAKNVPAQAHISRDWRAHFWSLRTLKERLGDTSVGVQTGRSADPDYEINAHHHRSRLAFDRFADAMLASDNDVYMTAGNRDSNREALAPLWADVGTLPPFLHQEPGQGFFWLGSNTVTPLHHDETQNVMCQVMGRKLVRVLDPDQEEKMQRTVGVHSSIGWPTEGSMVERGLRWHDYWLHPGEYLFLPVGWWHAVQSYGVACTIVYTNFIWPAFYGRIS